MLCFNDSNITYWNMLNKSSKHTPCLSSAQLSAMYSMILIVLQVCVVWLWHVTVVSSYGLLMGKYGCAHPGSWQKGFVILRTASQISWSTGANLHGLKDPHGIRLTFCVMDSSTPPLDSDVPYCVLQTESTCPTGKIQIDECSTKGGFHVIEMYVKTRNEDAPCIRCECFY